MIAAIAQTKEVHSFYPHMYIRGLWRPKGMLIAGAAHKTAHWNILVSGELSVYMRGTVKRIKGPLVFWSESGVSKMTYAHSDSLLLTVHETDETDLDKLEIELIEGRPEYSRHKPEIDNFRKLLENAA